MSEASKANKAIVRRLFDECMNQHKPDLYAELYSGVVYHAPAIGELRDEEHRQLLLSVFSGFPDAEWRIDDQVADDGRVVTRWKFVGTHNGTFMGMTATGRRLQITGMTIHQISGGKIVEQWEQWDTLGMTQQLGMLTLETSPGSWLPHDASPVVSEWDAAAKL